MTAPAMTAAEDHGSNQDKKERISSSFPSSFTNHNDDNNNNNNSNNNGELRSPEELRQIVHEFLPFALDDDDMVVHGFGYGSGVLRQHPQHVQGERKVVDVILVVRNAFDFHRANVQCNPHHYYNNTFGLRSSSPERAAWWQRHTLPENPWLRNPGVYFIVTPHLKYGIVQYEDFCSDLQHWKFLYLAGRMHKPVVTFKKDKHVQFLQQQHNLPAALAAALLIQYNNDHSKNQKMAAAAAATPLSSLYAVIASLSYQGDPRLTLAAEDPNKIAQLVAPQHFSRWNSLYADAMLDLQTAGFVSVDYHHDTFRWDPTNPNAHHGLWQSLPPHVRQQCGYPSPSFNNNKNNYSQEAANRSRMSLLTTAAAQALPTVLARAIVAPAARYQSFKGLWTAGATQSVRYAYRKFQKGRRM